MNIAPSDLIPHRPPFLLLDEIADIGDDWLRARAALRPEDELWSRIYAGHYPGNAITPGVLICEIIFQAGAALMAHRLRKTATAASLGKGTPVVVRIRDARFKRMVRPGDMLEVEARFEEQMANAYFLTGSAKVAGELAARVAFTCALVQ